ncbi:MAG TPA: SUF system Fe-S cluster assembly protein [Vicinamibacterales bacterium]|nr:SUF system Fe-S cluster assembly protein [Vicinamibacterales bacterium]
MKNLPIVPDPPAGDLPEAAGESIAALEPDPLRTLELRPKIIEALSTVYDPEIPVNIYELGLVYDIVVDRRSVVGIRMTLTAPACPAAQTLPGEVREKVRAVPGVADAIVEIVWDPPWSKDRMSEAAKLQLGLW